MKVELLHIEGCSAVESARQVLGDVLGHLAPGTQVTEVLVATEDEAAELGFQGSPSIRVNGVDVVERSPESAELVGTLNELGGVPAHYLIEAAVLRELGVRSFLFLCVANSARSQLAEGIARHLLGEDYRIQSAGSEPTSVRPEALEVLREIGIEAESQSSKSVQSIDRASVEAVITLCEEEVCPVFLGGAIRLHWGLPDPAAIEGPERLNAFRLVRDSLVLRLSALRKP